MIDRRKPVMVWWVDSCVNHGWGKVDPSDCLEIVSIGWVAYEDEERIILSAHSARPHGLMENVSDTMSIPKVAIIKTRRLTVPKSVAS